MNKRLVYVQSPKLDATPEQLKLKSLGCGMLLDQDINGISLQVLPQYQFEPQINLKAADKKLAKRLNIGFIWQKFHHSDNITHTPLIFERLLFIDYDTETLRADYPSFSDQGAYYEVGELVPYICIDQTRKKAMLYSDSDFQSYQIEEVLLSIHDPKYQTNEYHALFESQITPYKLWFINEEKKYHYSFTHQSYSHYLFMPVEEWKEKIGAWREKMTNQAEAENAKAEYELLLKKQANRINHEITRALSVNPKDFRTIDGFQEQLNTLKKQVRIIFHELPNMFTTSETEIDEIITDIDPNDSAENAMALQDLLTYMLNSSQSDLEQQNVDLFLHNFIANELTTLQAYKIFNICIYYFRWSLYDAKIQSNNFTQLDSYDRNLIAFASRMLIICLTFLINSTQFNK